MPIDPSIALQVRQPPAFDPLESYAKLLQIQHMQAAQPLELQHQQQQLDAGKLELDQKRRAVSDMQAIDNAFSQPGGRDAILGALPGHLKQVALKQFEEIDKSHAASVEASEKADAARSESMGRAAVAVREHQYAPIAAQGFLSDLKQKYADDPQVSKYLQGMQEQIQANPTPEGIKAIVDPIIASSPQRKVDISQMDATARMTSANKPTEASLAVGAAAGDTQSAAALSAMKSGAQKGKWVADYDENGKPIERWVAEGPGVVVPRQEAPVAPPRPLVLGQGAKAVDPTTGAVIAEGNAPPPQRPPAPMRVDTVNDAGQPVTRFAEPTAGQEFPKPPEPDKITRPREVKPGSEEAFVIAYAKKLGKRPDDLTIDDQTKIRQAWSRADDKPAAGAEDVGMNLSPAGLDAAAQNYARTGQLPPMGMGKQAAATKTKIVNRAAELYPDLDLAANSADYRSNRTSLVKLQQQRDAIGAFEQTAGKNIDVFLKEAGKVVDTGSPMANSLARMVSGKMLGSADQAGYDAARQVAINEIAKVTQGGGISGVLSDSARHEVEAFNPREATLKQTVAVMRILKQDMANRTIAMDNQLKEIRGRISPGKSGGSDSAAPAAPAAPSGVFSYQEYLKLKGGK